MSIVPSEVVPDKAKSEPVNPVTTDFPVKMPRRRRVRIRQSRNYRRDTMLTLYGNCTRFCDRVSRRNAANHTPEAYAPHSRLHRSG